MPAGARPAPADAARFGVGSDNVSGPTLATDWEARFRDGHTAFERGVPNSAFLAWRAAGDLVPGRVLVPGAGRSPEPRLLAEAGFAVTVMDAAPTAVGFQSAALAGLGATVWGGDLFDWESDARFDLVYDQTLLCALPPPSWPAYAGRLRRWLRPEGRLAVLFMQTGQAGGPPYHCDLGEMRTLFDAARWAWPEVLPQPVPHSGTYLEQPALLQRKAD